MVNYTEGLSRPFSDGEKFIIGSILAMIPIINLFVIGYALRGAEMVLKRKKKSYALPEWNNWGDLFVKGVLSAIISFVYAIPFIIVYLKLYFKFISNILLTLISTPEQLIIEITSIIMNNLLLVLLLVILGILTSIIIPMAILNYIKYGKFGAAFKFSEVLSKIKGGYILAWITAIVLSGILTGISSFIQLFSTVFGFIVNGFIVFIIAIITYTWFAEAYAGRY